MEPPDPVVRLKTGVEWHPVDDEIVALDLTASAYLGVNETGSRLWPLVAAGTTQAKLADELVAAFAIDRTQAETDAGVFVQQLRSLCLVADEE